MVITEQTSQLNFDENSLIILLLYLLVFIYPLVSKHKIQSKPAVYNMKYPDVVVFDLDYTLWPCWCDVHIELPIKNHKPETIVDSYGYKLSLYPDVPEIIRDLKRNGVKIISASRTPTVHIAKELISHIKIDNIPLKDYFDNSQWGTGSKTRHIKQAVKELGLEKELRDGSFILYDDEFRNKDVEAIGCKFSYIRDTNTGLTWDIYQKGLEKFN